MPRIAKDKTEKEEKSNNLTSKKTKTLKKETNKISKSKKEENKSSKPKKEIIKKSNSKKETKINSKTKTPTKKTPSKKSKKNTDNLKLDIIEYYDLPYKYGHTIVKILAQTPKTLFVYWEISNKDIEKYKKKFGEDFFNITKPILIVRNTTLKKTYEVEINDFANCWYLNIEDSDCKYDIELARKFISSPLYSKNKENDYLHITKSNLLRSPNNHILFEKLLNSVTFKNIKTGETIVKDVESYEFLKNVYNFYKNLYKDELSNPSSGFVIY